MRSPMQRKYAAMRRKGAQRVGKDDSSLLNLRKERIDV